SSVRDISIDPYSRGQDYPISHSDMIFYTNLAGHYAVGPQGRTTCYAGLPRYYSARTDFYVMGDLDQIVQFNTFSEPCYPTQGPIYGAQCSDFDVVAYFN